MPVSRVLVKARRLPSGENENPPSLAPAGTTTLRSAPVATVRKVMPVRPPGEVRAIGARIDAQAREPQHRLRHFGDGRHADAATSSRSRRAPGSPTPRAAVPPS